ncbi:chromosome segregation SMC, putative [Babesia ovis]|uniref:Chromosome segregation SMC, putative n=1 Tax=Babesia ovis TaxID=5869 RepID=A0A9W5WWC2_BABOV|nr:chromosome segregation SMC, putative [Babesia ovis]
MKIATSFLIFAASQLSCLLAKQPNNIDYKTIIPTVEKRFKIIMQMVNGGEMDGKFLKYTEEEFRKQCVRDTKEMLTQRVLVNAEEYFGGQGAVEPEYRVLVPDTEQIKHMCDERTAVLIQRLKDVTPNLDKLFKSLYGTEYKKLSEAVDSKKSIFGGSGLRSANISVEAQYLNLRFAMPQFYNDVKEFYDYINPERVDNSHITKLEESVVRRVKGWLNKHITTMKPLDSMDETNFLAAMKALYGGDNSAFDRLKIDLDVFNAHADDTKEAAGKCKQQNSALFGSVALLIATILTFTIM